MRAGCICSRSSTTWSRLSYFFSSASVCKAPRSGGSACCCTAYSSSSAFSAGRLTPTRSDFNSAAAAGSTYVWVSPRKTQETPRGMPELGFALSSEDHAPNDLVRQAALAEQAGFTFCLISDHYHPWITKQGHAPFVWSTLGGIAQATSTIRVGTGVTCPLIRIHPAIVAQAAATVGCMMPGRFFLGVGSGENLNEHVLGDRWPLPDERLEMLEEAVQVIRLLWQGGEQTHRGKHYTVDHARIYDLPDELPGVFVAAAQPNAAELAGRIGDGLISTSPDEQVVQR